MRAGAKLINSSEYFSNMLILILIPEAPVYSLLSRIQ